MTFHSGALPRFKWNLSSARFSANSYYDELWNLPQVTELVVIKFEAKTEIEELFEWTGGALKEGALQKISNGQMRNRHIQRHLDTWLGHADDAHTPTKITVCHVSWKRVKVMLQVGTFFYYWKPQPEANSKGIFNSWRWMLQDYKHS